MADIEKVIKAIECCVVNHTRCFDDNDKLCPYFSTKVYMCEIELLKDALSLLKEQEAVVPYQHDAVWLCGNCEQEVVGWDDTITCDEIRYPFCRKCGRSVKWNENT